MFFQFHTGPEVNTSSQEKNKEEVNFVVLSDGTLIITDATLLLSKEEGEGTITEEDIKNTEVLTPFGWVSFNQIYP